jgi:hypothetical protein
MRSLMVINIPIRQDGDGRFCLNDLHKAAVAKGTATKSQRPGTFMKRPETIALVAAIQKRCTPQCIAPTATKKGGAHGAFQQGTFVVKTLVYAYAMWIDADFHLDVIDAYDAMVSASIQRISDLQYRAACIELELKQELGNASKCGLGLRKWQDTEPRLKAQIAAIKCEMQPGLFLN